MSEETVHQRLRRIRIERGEPLSKLAQQSGLRVEWLQAIEDGRFNDLPSGIYGRSAVRRASARARTCARHQTCPAEGTLALSASRA